MASKLEPPPVHDQRPAHRDRGYEPPEALRMPQDKLGRRLLWAAVVSCVVNFAIFRFASQVVRNHILPSPPPIVFRRIILPRPHRPKPVVKKKIAQKVVKPKPVARPKPKTAVKPPPPKPQRSPPPPTAHHHILTANGPTAETHTALPGGNAQLGQPIAQQNPGQGTNNNTPPPTPQPAPPPPAPKPTPTPPPPTPQPAPPPPKPTPPPPTPAGPTQDAQPAYTEKPTIPDDLTQDDFSSSVEVKVSIAADGSFTASLLSSSGNVEVDNLALDALRHWKWKPALVNGKSAASSQRFRFDFEVN